LACAINILKNSNENNKLAIFVGAGVSKSSNLPDWNELITDIKKELKIGKNENDYLKISQLFYLSCGEVVYYQRLKEYFPDTVEPTNIQKLIFELKPANIITTNWDILLEKTANDNGYIYDVISKDEDLVQSKLQQHIIKMHGDFKDNNIVFKEDDYINYKENFPLIENYIKSILSTHTILFLGYSYNDINLKQITKWIQNNSKSMPPMFLTVNKKDENQSKYLENFGIKTLVLEDEKDFDFDSRTNKLATFLHNLNTPDENLFDIENITDLEVVNYIYEKLNPLDVLDSILTQQIQSTLSNCGFVYEDTPKKKLILLEFYKEALTFDINKDLREIYTKFRSILQKDKLEDNVEYLIKKIFTLLKKSNVDGIVLSDDFSHPKKYLPFFDFYKDIDYSIEKLCNFKFDDFEADDNDIKELMRKSFYYYQKYKFLKAYKLTQKIVRVCLKQKEYTQLFFAMFNYNTLLNRLKASYLEDDIDFNNIKPYDLESKFYELPKKIQKILKDIKPFLSYDYLYRFASEIDDQLNEKLKQKENIEKNNSLTFDTNITRNYSKQKNLINFVLNNNLMIEKNSNFNSVNQKLINISLIRQIQNKYLTLDKMELYATIKYIEHKELIRLFGSINLELNILPKDINWIVKKVLPNIVSLYNEDKTIYSHFRDELENIFYILSLQNLTNYQSKAILKQFKIIIESHKIRLDMYETINKFIESQNDIEHNGLIEILELMINKFICVKWNYYDYEVLEKNYFYSPFKHLSNDKTFKYKNKILIEKLLITIQKYDEIQKIHLSKGFLMNLHLISNKKIQKMIKNFMLNIDTKKIKKDDSSKVSNYGLKLSFKVFLAIKNFIKVDKKLIKEIQNYPKKERDNIYFLGEITSQVRYLVEKKGIKELEDLLKHLLKVIDGVNEKMKERANRSII
jgi:hypothetical protein